jgi:DNA replication licensing factor MCM6
MIRLSEAIARANCVNEITPAFVKEAFNLLKQSIIHVEKDDVEVEEDDDDEPEEGVQGEAPVEAAEDVKKEKTKIQYDKYVHMMNLIIRRLDEDERGGGQGIERDELVMWYLEQAEDEIATEEQHHEEAQLVRKVLKRLKKVSLPQDAGLKDRIIILWRFVGRLMMRIWRLRDQRRLFMSFIRIVMLRISG